MVRVTNVEAVRASDRENKIPAPPKKIQHNSGFLDGSWASWDDPGAGGVVRDSLSGLEDGRELFKSCAALREHPGRHTSRQGKTIEKLFWERKFAAKLSENLQQNTSAAHDSKRSRPSSSPLKLSLTTPPASGSSHEAQGPPRNPEL